MLHSIKGKVLGQEEGRLHLDVGPFVIEIFVPVSFIAKRNSEIRMFTSMFIREENLVLYGFRDESEKKFFQLALTVPGVGPKLALSLLGTMALSDLACALQEGNTRALEKVPGVGKKLAQRLFGDLKDKAAPFAVEAHMPKGQAIEVLVDLGLTPVEARKAVEEISGKDHSVNDLVNLSLKKLGGAVS